MNIVRLKNYTTKSRQGTECQMVISRKSASKNQKSALPHYLETKHQGPVPERRNNSIPGINVPYFRDNFIPGINSVPEKRNNAIKGINLG